MNCDKYLPLIEDLIEGELDEKTAQKVISYLAICAECRAFYENLRREKEAYAQYLFTAEPPANLWQNFQTKLEAEKEITAQPTGISSLLSGWKSKLAAFPRLVPAAAALAAMLFAVGISFALLQSKNSEKFNDGAIAAHTKSETTKSENPPPAAQSPDEKSAIRYGESDSPVFKTGGKQANSSRESGTRPQTIRVKLPVVKRNESTRKLPATGNKNAPEQTAKLSAEEQAQILALKNLETESRTQIEKVELLLRSFRNASNGDGAGTFDIQYEKQQARRLLDKNSQLRLAAEFYGATYTGELLSRAEPVLLDIANLDLNAAPAKKVQDIKERLHSQNLIASLQTY